MTSTVHDTARSLLAYFGTMAEWGERGSIGVHDATPELMALVCAVLDIVPAAWHPYSPGLERDDGWVNLYQPTQDEVGASMGSYDRHMAVHSVPRPPRYVDRDPGQPAPSSVDKAAVAALVGLAGGPDCHHPGLDVEPGYRRLGSCARAMATLTDEEIAKAEQDDLGGECG